MSTMRYIEKLANAPWLADQEHVEFLHGIYLRYLDRIASGQPLDTEAIEQELGRPLDNAQAVSVRDGVARVPVVGTIVQRANLFTSISGGVSTQKLALDLTAARNDPAVHSILLVLDSPGGEAHGINELAGAIREIRDSGEKRIEAYCDGDCASAAYWLASATSRVTADATAAVGSIGVVTRIRNPEAAGDKQQILEFWNARSPKKRLDPNSEAGRASIQGYVDDMGDEFIRAVADNRGVPEEKVVSDFGQGFVLTGRKAVAAGLADALGSEEEVIARLQRREEPMVTTHRQDAASTETQIAAEDNARGILARIGSLISGSGIAVPGEALAQSPVTDTGGSSVKLESRDGADVLVADSGEELELSAEDRERLAGERDETLAGELESARADRDRYMAAYEEAIGKARTEAVEREMAAFVADGVPPYLIDLARPALAGGYDAAADSPEATEATRWRSVLEGSKGNLEHGERGNSGGKPMGEMSDHEKVQAALAERGLGKESYANVAGELIASGEIKRDANQEGE